MTFPEELQQLITKFVNHYENRGQRSEAISFKSGLSYFQRFLSSQRSHISCLSELTRKDIDLYLSYLWSVEYGEHMQVAHLYRESFVYRSLRSLHKLFEYIIINEDTINIRHLPKPNLIEKADFPQPNRRSAKHFPAWFDKYMCNAIKKMPEKTTKQLLFKAQVMILYYVGARASDICTLERGCFITKLGFTWMRIFGNKTRRYYEIPITPDLNEILEKVIESTPDNRVKHPTLHQIKSFVFLNTENFEYFKRHFSYRAKKFMLRIYQQAKEEGLPVSSMAELRLTTHKFRHTVAVRLIRMGADPMLVAEFLGHKDLSMAQAYIQESEAEIEAILADLWEDDTLELEKNYLDDIEITKEDVLRFKGPVTKTECGWCAHLSGKPPCGADPYGCWLCDDLKPDLQDPEYVGRLTVHLVDHQTLLERNRRMGFLGEAKVEEKIIARITGFIAQAQAIGEC